jgi:hypothetical protein
VQRLWGILLVAALASATNGLLAGAPDQERVASETAGISLVPPAGWHVVSMPQVMSNRAQVRLPDAELQAGFQRATAPLFVFSKYPEPFPRLNPTVQVVLRPRPASLPTSAAALLRIATGTLEKAFPDFAIVEPIRDTQVSGLPAACLKATYTLTIGTQGKHRVLSRTCVVPRGSFMFLVGMSGAPSGEDLSEAEFAGALRSISIAK